MEALKLRIKTKSKIELAEKAITTYCYLKDIKINNTNITVLAYFAVYGFNRNTKEMILRSKILNNPTSIDNALSKLRSKGLVLKVDVGLKTDTGRDDICENLRFEYKDSLGFIIKLENL